MTRKIAILEKTRTPYRPPLFEYVGRKVDLTVYYVGRTPSYRNWDTTGKEINYDSRDLRSKDIGPFSVVPSLKETLVQEGYDEIYLASEMNMLLNSYLGVLAAKELNADVTTWNEYIITPWIKGEGRSVRIKALKKGINPILHFAQKYIYSKSDRIIAYSRLAEQSAAQLGASESKIVIAPPWYPPEIFPAAEEEQENSDKFRVLFVGRLSHRKGIDTLLKTVDKYQQDDNIEFAIAGTGPLEREVSAAAKENPSLDRLGYIQGSEKAAEFQKADVFVLPSRHDPWGQVVNESYICSTPVITTDSVGAEMIVPDNLTVQPASVKKLCAAIEHVRNNQVDVPDQPSKEKMAEPLVFPIGGE